MPRCSTASPRSPSATCSLIKVSGIGAKLALTILSGTDADELARCVHDDDVAALTRLPGIGRKTAQRLLVELRDRMPSDPAGATGGDGAGRPQSPENDAREALISLGFKPDDAARRLREVADPSLSAEPRAACARWPTRACRPRS
jgi:Holliday junction DNA helicase RuvA